MTFAARPVLLRSGFLFYSPSLVSHQLSGVKHPQMWWDQKICAETCFLKNMDWTFLKYHYWMFQQSIETKIIMHLLITLTFWRLSDKSDITSWYEAKQSYSMCNKQANIILRFMMWFQFHSRNIFTHKLPGNKFVDRK